MMKARRSRILDYASSIGCDTVVAFQPENVYYLTGFWGEAIALCTNLGTKLITPKLEVTRALRTAKESDVITSERGAKMISTLARVQIVITILKFSVFKRIPLIDRFLLILNPFINQE